MAKFEGALRMSSDLGFVKRPTNDEEQLQLQQEQHRTAMLCVESVLRRHRLRGIPVRDKKKRAEVIEEIKLALDRLGILESLKEFRAL